MLQINVLKKGREAPELSLIASKINFVDTCSYLIICLAKCNSRVEKCLVFENFVGDVTNFVYSETSPRYTVPTNNK